MDPSPALPLNALAGELVCERVAIGERTFLVQRPTAHSALPGNAGLPCWVELWPAARMLARLILAEPWTPGTAALEIGCGLGLPGIAALSMGLDVTFSDCDPLALQFADTNARLNGLEKFQTRLLDWCHPPKGWQVPVVLASDPVFEMRHVESVADCIKRLLLPAGVCLLTEQDRVASGALGQALTASGLDVTEMNCREVGPDGRRVKGKAYRIRVGRSAR